MSEIRPAAPRPEPLRQQEARPVQSEPKVKEAAPQKSEPRREVVNHEVPKTDKLKGGNVDIKV
jgi:hypothetical protein